MAKGNAKASSSKAKPKTRLAKATNPPIDQVSNNSSENLIPSILQQKCLDLFQQALEQTDADHVLLQEVKGHLFNRDFRAAFGKLDYLRVYAARWSPSRALAYAEIFAFIDPHLRPRPQSGDGVVTPAEPNALNAVCLGGGAGAEVIALGTWLYDRGDESISAVHAYCVDIAAWQTVIDGLHAVVTQPRTLPKYASKAAQEANVPILQPNRFAVSFTQADILDAEGTTSVAIDEAVAKSDLVTIMFTLNELYSTSMAGTQKMLARLTERLQPGAHLLVVDSPGSYSTVALNGAEKKYPMQWLLDYTLLGGPSSSAGHDAPGNPSKWLKILEDESKWFRLSPDLKYPIQLENMRYQIHLYRRVADQTTNTSAVP